MKPIFKAVAAALALSSLVTGCAVYGPPPAYGSSAYYQPAPAYVAPAPVYAAPAPVYAAPPVSLGFSFGTWGGYGHHHHHHW